MRTIKRFQVNTDALSDKEKMVLEKLIQASELIAPLFERQIASGHSGANFYPGDAVKQEIKEAAKKNPGILHPYTFVERDKKGGLMAVPFCVKFKKELKEITKLLGEAAKISEDKEFSKYLKEMAGALLKNDYAKNEILWVTRGPFKISFMIGPVERYFDKLFFKKCAYQAWVGINDEERTREVAQFKKIILTSRRKIFPDTRKVDLPKLRLGVSKTSILAGQKANFMTLGTNLPNDTDLMEKHGSRFEVFDSSHSLTFDKQMYPIFNSLFDKSIRDYFSKQELYQAYLRTTPLHEISHSLIRYQDAESRLEELFPIFDELMGELLGMKSCGILILKGTLSQKELEAIILVGIVRNFCLKNNISRIHYAIGGAITHSFYLQDGALKQKGKFLYPDFTKLFICIDHLSRVVEYYLASGSYKEAKKFVDEYGSFKVFEKYPLEIEKLEE